MSEKGVEEQVLAMERLRFNPERNNNLGFYTSLQRISMKRNIPRDFLLIKNGCRVVSPAAADLIIIDLHNSAPMQESAYDRIKRITAILENFRMAALPSTIQPDRKQ